MNFNFAIMLKKQTQKNQKIGKKIVKRKDKNENIRELLDKQTSVILDAVDKRLQMSDLKTDKKLREMDKRLQMSDLKTDRKLQEMEIKADQRFNRIMTNLDLLLKRTTDTDDEIRFIKLDINRIKKVVKEKLDVDLM